MRLDLRHGECKEVMQKLIDEGVQVDSCVTDPPYHLKSIVERFGNKNAAPAKHGRDGSFGRLSKGFMGQTWDGGDIANDPEMWNLVFQLLKPGGYLLAFGGTRTYHRMTCGIEDAGFDIRDCIMWLYGSGFPKSRNISKDIDKKGLDGSEYEGYGTALKPAFEPIVVARKPIEEKSVADNVLTYGTGAINIDGCRVPTNINDDYGRSAKNSNGKINAHEGFEGKSFNIKERDGEYYSNKGRYPANVIHDGSDEVLEKFKKYGTTKSGRMKHEVAGYDGENNTGFLRGISNPNNQHGDSGSVARFFYCAKASKKDRGEGNNHPTVKPTELMRYLVKMVTPKNGVVLDPFMGSGSTGKAAKLEEKGFIGIDMTEEYYNIAKKRIDETEVPDTLPIEDDK